MGNAREMNRQTPEDRVKDAGRDASRKIKQKITMKTRRRIIMATSSLLLLIILFIIIFGLIMIILPSQQGQAKETAKTIYETLEIDSLIDLVEIKGDDRKGHYYGFVEGAEEKLDEVVKEIQRGDGTNAITKDLLKKIIKAEVVSQFPFLKGSASGGKGGDASSYTGNDIAEKTWNFLRGHGFTEYAIAGLMGNIHQESGGFNPSVVENGGSGEGIGLIQWSYSRRKQLERYASSMGKHWQDVNVQLDFLLMELTPGGSQYANFQFIPSSAYEQWKNASSPEEAARIFSDAFERPGTPMMENRTKWAKIYYDQYQGTFNPEEDMEEQEIDSLDGVLFIGDSITKRIELFGMTPSGSTVKAEVGWNPSDWIEHFGELPEDSEDITAVCIMLGTNNPYEIGKMKTLLGKLQERYVGKPIFVQRIVPHPNAQAQSQTYNSEMENYCNSQDGLYFIDTLDGVTYEDNVHPTADGMRTLLQNIEDEICNGSYSSGGTPLGEFEGTIRIRRVTPNKGIGETKNTASGPVQDTSTQDVSSALSSQIQNYIEHNATSGDWSVYAKNLNTNTLKTNINNKKLESASLIKLFIMATAYEEIAKGTLNKADVINDIKIMINQSDNDATNRMIDKLGFTIINNYIKANGYTSTEINRKMLQTNARGDNYTSAQDVGKILEEIYRGTCVTQDASEEMLAILKTQTRKTKIPAGVPPGVETANKTGELDDVENDAAIVFKEGANYILVVMSNNVNDTAAARNNIKEISSKVYSGINSSGSSQGGTNPNAVHKVAIVAGHGTTNHAGSYEEIANRTKWYTTGTSGVTPSGQTMLEWQITKKVANYVEDYLSSYSNEVSVVQVGYSQANWERMQLAKNQGVDAYIGIHFNSSENTNANGVSAYYRNGDDTSQSFAKIFTKNVSEIMGLEDNGVMSDSTSNNGQLDSIGNSATWGFPSILVEGGFMSSRKDMEVIGADKEEGLKKYAQGIVAGILEYYGIENRGINGNNIISTTSSTSSGINSKIYDLRYVSPEKFQEYVDSNSSQALYTYTLDKDTKKLIVANWSYDSERSPSLEITACNPINFRAVLNKYTMPMEYLIDFLVHTDDAEMVGKLADLAIDTEYIIAIQDNVTTVQTIVDTQEKKSRYIQVLNRSETIEDWHNISTKVSVQENVSNKIELTYADSWFVKFSKTSSYATMASNDSEGNGLKANQGESLGDFYITTYCSACHSDGNGGFGTTTTASGREATENHTIAVHAQYFNGNAADGNLSDESQVVINGKVYTVDDIGDTEEVRPNNWIGIYIPTKEGECVCNHSSLNSNATTVYVAENVRDADSEDDDDIEWKNKTLKGVNEVSNQTGTVTDTSNMMEQYLGSNMEIEQTAEGMQTQGIYIVTEQKEITTVRTVTNQYDSGDEGEIQNNEQKFVDAFLSSEGILNRFNINWMETLLAQDEKTVNMIDLTNYLYRKALGQESSEQDEDEKYHFEVYKNNDLYKIYTSGDILEEFMKSLINNPLRLYINNHTLAEDENNIFKYIATDTDELTYKMITNEVDGRGFGFDVFHRLNETDWDEGNSDDKRVVNYYDDAGIKIKNFVDMSDKMEADVVDEVMRKNIQKWKDKVTESTKEYGLKLEDYQIDALTAIAYTYGWNSQYTASFKNAYQTYYLTGDKEGFRKYFYVNERTQQPFYVQPEGAERTEKEIKEDTITELIWNLFDTGKYKTPDGEILDPDSFHGGNGELLGVAEEIWKEVCDRFTAYGGNTTPPSSPTIDCSGYVSWVLYQYGIVTGDTELVNEFNGWQHTTETLKTVDWEKFGFEVIPVAAGQDVRSILQPGDILDRSVGNGANGHTQIIVEVKNGTVYTYDCGGVNNWRGKHGNPHISNFAASDSRPGIIIRKK